MMRLTKKSIPVASATCRGPGKGPMLVADKKTGEYRVPIKSAECNSTIKLPRLGVTLAELSVLVVAE